MYYVVVTDFTKPIKFFMLDSPFVGAAKVLYQHDLGTLKELHEKLKDLPHYFGPVRTKSEAERLRSLLLGVGACSTIEEAGQDGKQ